MPVFVRHSILFKSPVQDEKYIESGKVFYELARSARYSQNAHHSAVAEKYTAHGQVSQIRNR